MAMHLTKTQRRGLAVLAEAYKTAHAEGHVNLYEFPYLPHPSEPYPPFRFMLRDEISALASFAVGFNDALTAHVALWPTEKAIELISDYDADFRAGDAFVTGALSPIPVRQLSCSKARCRRPRLSVLGQLSPPPADQLGCFLGSHLKRRDGSVEILGSSHAFQF
jgi:hypothetical protein